jgi:drug/metabolite transporter (DMT)-like permease
MQHRKAILILFVTALIWSLGGLLIKSVPWSPLAVASARSLIAAAFLLVVLRPRKISLSGLTLMTAVCSAGCTILFVVATKMTTAANAILLQYSAPIWVALFGAWILREHPTRLDWIVIVSTLCGIGLFFADKLSFDHFVGNVIALISGVFFGFIAILMRKQKGPTSFDSILLGTLLGGIVCSPALLSVSALDTRGWLALLLLGTIQLGLGYLLYAWATRHVSALEAVLIPVIEPILNPVWVMLAYSEKPSNWALVGGAIVLASSVFRAWMSLKRVRSCVPA